MRLIVFQSLSRRPTGGFTLYTHKKPLPETSLYDGMGEFQMPGTDTEGS